MGIGEALKKMLEAAGYKDKGKEPAKHSLWTLDHKQYMIVNYHKSNNEELENNRRARTVSFNYLGKYMRDEAFKINKHIMSFPNEEQKRIYRKVLSQLEFFDKIGGNFRINNSRKNGTHYIHIAEDVGLDIFAQILEFIIEDSGKENSSPKIKRQPICENTEEYLPDFPAVLLALHQLGNKAPTREEILNQIEKNPLPPGKVFKKDWREITKLNISLWFRAKQ